MLNMMMHGVPNVTFNNARNSVVADGSDLEGYMKVVSVVVLIIIATAGLLGNSLVILAVALSKKLQNNAHIYVVTLAATDFLNAFNQVIHLGVLLSPSGSADVHRACALVGALNVIIFGYSIGVLVLIAINRLQVITNNKNAKTQTRKKAAASITVLFLLVPVFTCIICLIEGTAFGKNHGICKHEGFSLDLATGLVMLLYLIIVVVCYVKIFLHVRRHFHQVSHINKRPSVAQRERTRPSSISVITLEPIVQQARSDRRRHSMQSDPWNQENRRAAFEGRDLNEDSDNNQYKDNWDKESKITLNMFLVVLSFVVCVLPAMCLLFVPGNQDYVSLVAFLLLISNCCWNPVIYAWKHPDFKHTFRCIIRGKLLEIKEPALWLRVRLNAL